MAELIKNKEAMNKKVLEERHLSGDGVHGSQGLIDHDEPVGSRP